MRLGEDQLLGITRSVDGDDGDDDDDDADYDDDDDDDEDDEDGDGDDDDGIDEAFDSIRIVDKRDRSF